MGTPFVLQRDFNGMYQDLPRDQVPGGQLWNCVDFIPSYLGAPLRKRGGWFLYGQAPIGSDGYIQALSWLSTTLYAIESNGHMYAALTGTDIGTAFAVAQNPIIHRNGTVPLMVIPAASGSTTAKSYDGTTFGNLAGTPPTGIYGDVWNDRTLLANSTANPGRLWFGPIGNAAGTWDTTNSWLDFATAITGVATLRAGILVFHSNSTDIITGTTAPSATTIGDLSVRAPAFNVGCADARSIVKYNDTVIWADSKGVYQSDGATVKSLTATGGIQSLWRSRIGGGGYTGTLRIAGGIFNNTYIVSLTTASPAFWDCFAYDLAHGFWYRLSNIPALAFQPAIFTTEETYFGYALDGRIGALSSILTPTTHTLDGNGPAVLPYYETGLYRGWQHFHRKWVPSMALQSWKSMYFNYELLDGGAVPYLTVSYATDPNASSYTALSPTLAANTAYGRVRRDIQIQGNGIMFKVQQTNSSEDTRLHALEVEYNPLDTGRLAQ